MLNTIKQIKNNISKFLLPACIFLLITLPLILLPSCKNEKATAYYIPEDSMINILVDLHIIEGILTFETDSITERATKYYHCYFENNKIDTQRYNASLKYYYKDSKRIDSYVNEAVIKRLSIIEGEIDRKAMMSSDVIK